MSVIKSAIRRIFPADSAGAHTVSFVDGESIKLARVRRTGSRIVLEAAYSKRISPGDAPEDIAAILNADKPLLRRFGKTDITDLAQGRGVYCKIVDIPRMSMKEAASALKFTERDSAPLSLADSLTGVWELGPNGAPGRIKVFMTAINENGSASHREMFRDAGFRLSRVSTLPAAITSLVRHSRIPNETGATLVINITGDGAGIYFFHDKTPLLLREIRGGTGDATSTRIDRLGKEVSRSMEYIHDKFQLTGQPSIFIMGAVAPANGLAGHIEKTLGIPARIYNPFDDFVSLSPDCAETVKGKESEFAAIIGSAVDGEWSLKLAEPKSGGKMAPIRAGRSVLMAVGAVSVALLILWGTSAERMENRIAALSADIAVMKKQGNNAAISGPGFHGKRNVELARQTTMRPAPPVIYDWEAIFRQIASMTPGNTALTDLQIYSSEDKDGKPPLQRNDSAERIKISGIVRGSAVERIIALDSLRRNLSSSATFRSVSIVATSGSRVGNKTDLLTFEITALLNPAQKKNLTASSTGYADRES